MLGFIKKKEYSHPFLIWLVLLLWYLIFVGKFFPAPQIKLNNFIAERSFWFFNQTPKEAEGITIVAIDEASDYNKILAQEGTYSEYIDFKGKKVKVETPYPYSWDRVTNTIIDASNHENSSVYNEDVVEFVSGEGSYSTLRGFTITGRDTGIYCFDTSPTISNCTISDNIAQYYGAGIDCYFSSPVIIDCKIERNYIVSELGAGAAINCEEGSPSISHCTIRDNDSSNIGGGIACYNANPQIFNCFLIKIQ